MFMSVIYPLSTTWMGNPVLVLTIAWHFSDKIRWKRKKTKRKTWNYSHVETPTSNRLSVSIDITLVSLKQKQQYDENRDIITKTEVDILHLHLPLPNNAEGVTDGGGTGAWTIGGAAGNNWGLLGKSSNVRPVTEALNRGFLMGVAPERCCCGFEESLIIYTEGGLWNAL